MKKNEQTNYDRKQFLSTLMKIEHGKLEGFLKEGLLASQVEPELFAHFIAWNQIKGKVRDSKVAYPVIGLRSVKREDRDLAENAVAHLMLLSPRDLVRAYDFNKQLTAMGHTINAQYRKLLEHGMNTYLQVRETNQKMWDRTVLVHRESMKRLYRITHRSPVAGNLGDRPQKVLFDNEYPAKSIFETVKNFRNDSPSYIAGAILKHNIPFEVVVGSVPNIKHPDILLALIEGMTGNQIVTNSKMLEKLGVKNDPILNAAYQSALERATKDKRLNVLKAGVAAERVTLSAMSSRGNMADDLRNLQAKATTRQLGGIDGDWLVLGDCSGSMSSSVELAKKIAALITERVKGKVWLIFFNTHPFPFNVTGKTFFQIEQDTKRIIADGGTSIGCGLDYILAKRESVDGIVVVSDGGENTSPYFGSTYINYCLKMDKEPTVYFFNMAGENDIMSRDLRSKNIQFEEFDFRTKKIDYYSLPNIVQTLRVNRYSLVDEIMETPLLKISDALAKREN